MALPGETVGPYGTRCEDCGNWLIIGVQHSNAGYYVGYWCDNDGPYSRESGYYRTFEEAEKALKEKHYGR